MKKEEQFDDAKLIEEIESLEQINEKDFSLRTFLYENRRLIIGILAFALLLTIISLIFRNEISSFDNFVYNNIAKTINPTLTNIFKVFTNIGAAPFLIAVTVILTLAIKKRRYGIYIIYNLIFSSLGNYLLKYIFERQRPDVNRLIPESGYSFPSGHSTVSMAFYGFLIYLIHVNVKNKKIKIPLITLLSCTIVMIGVSRIYLGVHYTSDVCGGFLLSICYLTIFTKVVKEINIKLDNKEKLIKLEKIKRLREKTKEKRLKKNEERRIKKENRKESRKESSKKGTTKKANNKKGSRKERTTKENS